MEKRYLRRWLPSENVAVAKRPPWMPGLLEDLLYRWQEEREQDSVGFDALHGTETAKFSWFDDYEPTRPEVVDATLDVLALDWSRFSFVDLGSGKGRVLLIAARRPFLRVAGVEISPGLHQIAKHNVERAQRLFPLAAPIFLFCEDVLTQPLPAGDLVLYLFNPFGPDVVDAVLGRLEPTREVHVIYVNPLHADVVERHGFVERARGGQGEVHVWRVYSRPSPRAQ